MERIAELTGYDKTSIYKVPLQYHAQGLDDAVLDAFGTSPKGLPNITRWEEIEDRLAN